MKPAVPGPGSRQELIECGYANFEVQSSSDPRICSELFKRTYHLHVVWHVFLVFGYFLGHWVVQSSNPPCIFIFWE
jgi:hypothetical protein